MKRRELLKNIGIGGLGGVVGAGIVKLNRSDSKSTGEAEVIIPDVQNGKLKKELERDNLLNSKTFFTKSEFAILKILVDIIIPADKISGSATSAGVHDFIEFMVKDMPQYQVPFRGGLMWVESMSKKMYAKKFVQLETAEKLAVVDLIAYPNKAKPENSQGVAFFNQLRNLTATGFFTSKIGIEDLGYKGNTPNQWNGVPDDVLAKHNLSYADWEKHVNKNV